MPQDLRLLVGSDAAGFDLKDAILADLQQDSHVASVEDLGVAADDLKGGTYPSVAIAAATKIAAGVCGGGRLTGTDRPVRLVGDDHPRDRRGRAPVGNSRAHLAHADVGRRRGVSARGFADAEDRDEAVAERGAGLRGDDGLGLAELGAAFGVPDHDVRTADLGQLGSGDLTGVGAAVLGREVLRADQHAGAVDRRQRSGNRDEGGEHDKVGGTRLDALVRGGQRGQCSAVVEGAGVAEVHLEADRHRRPCRRPHGRFSYASSSATFACECEVGSNS